MSRRIQRLARGPYLDLRAIDRFFLELEKCGWLKRSPAEDPVDEHHRKRMLAAVDRLKKWWGELHPQTRMKLMELSDAIERPVSVVAELEAILMKAMAYHASNRCAHEFAEIKILEIQNRPEKQG